MASRSTATARQNAGARPFLKWAGGKRQLLGQFDALYPSRIESFVEVFTGSAAVFFDAQARFAPRRSTLLDHNDELVNCYRVVRDDIESLLLLLAEHSARHGREHYYRVRAQQTADLGAAARAARLLYLNRTCYNGLYRVNSRGEFNVPMGAYARPRILDEALLRAASEALMGVHIETADFREAAAYARRGDFVYLDPPYVPLSASSSFTSYTRTAFRADDQRALADVYRELDRAGCLVMLSNSSAPLVRELYAGYRIERVTARRAINSAGAKRGAIDELVVLNY
jgi:DNA adenine methylase